MIREAKLLILRLTNRCNLACKYCYAESSVADMSFGTAKKAIDLFSRPGDKLKIQFTGGEPLLRLDLMLEISRYIKEVGIEALFSIQTNGTLLTQEACIALKEMNCAIGISIDGMGATNNGRVYPNGSPAFQNIIAGIRNLASHSIKCNINAVVSRINQSELPALIDLAAYLPNVCGVGLDMFRPIGRGKGNEYAPNITTLAADIMRMLERWKELSSLGANVRLKELEKVHKMENLGIFPNCYCYAQTGYSVAVDPHGDIYPCSSFVGMKEMHMGNVYKGIGIFPAMLGMDERCRECSHASFCRGGCPAGRIAYGGHSAADCLMHRTIIEFGRKIYA